MMMLNCHLKKFASTIQFNTKQLASVQMVVGKMHMKGHTDPWCKEHCDPFKFQALQKVSLTSQSLILLSTL